MIYLSIALLGILIFSQAVAMIGLDPLPGDITLHISHSLIKIPVLYSLGAVAIMGLLYWAFFR